MPTRQQIKETREAVREMEAYLLAHGETPKKQLREALKIPPERFNAILLKATYEIPGLYEDKTVKGGRGNLIGITGR